MFRYSIRDLLLLTLVTATCLGWLVDHWQLRTVLLRANAENENQRIASAGLRAQVVQLRSSLYTERNYSNDQVNRIEQELAKHGLELICACDGTGSGRLYCLGVNKIPPERLANSPSEESLPLLDLEIRNSDFISKRPSQ